MLDSYQQITLPVTFCILASEALHVLLVPTWDYCQPFLKINSLRKFRLALINEHYRYFSRWWIFHLVLLSDLIVVLFTAWYDYQVLFFARMSLTGALFYFIFSLVPIIYLFASCHRLWQQVTQRSELDMSHFSYIMVLFSKQYSKIWLMIKIIIHTACKARGLHLNFRIISGIRFRFIPRCSW